MNDQVWAFARGFVAGLSIAAPVGPMGVLCLRRTLSEGRWNGLLTGLGVATADLCYGALAALGVTRVAQMLSDQAYWMRWGGGVFLLYLGFQTFRASPATVGAPATRAGLWGAYASALLLTLANPVTIFSFVGIFSGLLPPGSVVGSALVLVAGVFFGSAAWWLALSWAADRLRTRLKPPALGWINRLSGAVITLYGVMALAR